MGLVEHYKRMIEVFTKPSKVFSTKKKTTFMDGLKDVLIGSLTVSAIFGLVILLSVSFLSGLTELLLTGLIGTLPMVGNAVGFMGELIAGIVAVTIIIVIPIVAIITWLLYGLVMWLIAKAAGSKKEAGEFLGVFGLYMGAIFLAMIAMVIPILGSIIVLLVMIYSLYVLYKLLSEYAGIEPQKAALAILILLFVLFLYK